MIDLTRRSAAAARVAIYARYSDERQNPLSVRDQLSVCGDRASREGWYVAEQFFDEAISGSVSMRPGYQALRGAINEGRIDIVVAEALDRLSRDQEETANLYKLCVFNEVQIFTLSEGFVSELHVGLSSTINAVFLRQLGEKVRRGLRAKITDGLSAGGLAYGYRIATDAGGIRQTGVFLIEESEAKVIRRILEAYASGESPKRIAIALNNEGIASPSGGHWKVNTIVGNRQRGTGILNNELYIGRRVWNRLRYLKRPGERKRVSRLNPPEEWIVREAPELRIVLDELWYRVKARQQAHDAKRVAREVGDSNGLSGSQSLRRAHYLLSGLVRCGCCGGPLTIAGTGAKRYYCANAREKGPMACAGIKGIRKDDLERIVLSGIQNELMRPEAVSEFVEAYARHFNELTREKAERATAAAKRLKAIDKEIANLVGVLARGLHSLAIEDRLKALEDEKAQLLKQAADESEALPEINPRVAELYRRKVEDLAGALSTADARTAAGEALRGLLEKIVVNYDPDAKTHTVEIVGELAALLGFAQNENAAAIAAASGSLKLVAGAGFEPATFRL